jgi:hypothetical protein
MVSTCPDCGQIFLSSSEYNCHRQDENYTFLRFLCCLYTKSRNDNDVRINGMTPRDIYDRLELEATIGIDLINWRVQMLVTNCLRNGHIARPGKTGRIIMTASGNEFCSTRCGGIPICRD